VRADLGLRHDPFGRYRRKLTQGDIAVACKLYDEGWTTPRLARIFGVTWQAVHYHLRKRGVPLRVRNRLPRGATRLDRDAGVIITAKEQTTGVLRTLHEPGSRLQALYAVIERLDRMPGDWKIICYSNPDTIYSDLKLGPHRGGTVEQMILSRIDRLDLLDPSLDNGYPSRGKPK
jgi:hypothetical protein